MPRSVAAVPTIGTAKVVLETSPVFELIATAIAVAHKDEKPQPWLEDLTAAIGVNELDRISSALRRYRFGMDLVELAAEAPDVGSVDGFLEFVSRLDDRSTAFYLLGRLHPREQIPAEISAATITQLLAQTGTADSVYHIGADLSWADDMSGTRKEIADLLGGLWYGWLRDRIAELEPKWRQKLDELRRFLEENGGYALWRSVTDTDDLPMQVPSGIPYRAVRFMPCCNSAFPTNYLFGYGEVIVLASCSSSLEELAQQRRSADEILTFAKAISDPSRLKMLRIISKKCHELNGKQIAEYLGLSPSVVSRHLQQLRSAGLVREQSPDNRTITYSVDMESLKSISEHLVDYVTRS